MCKVEENKLWLEKENLTNKQPHGLLKIYYISAILTIKYIVFPIYLIGSVDGKKIPRAWYWPDQGHCEKEKNLPRLTAFSFTKISSHEIFQ